MTQSEVGAVPKNMDDRELMFPTAGTCQESGVKPRDFECSQDCLYECKTPICSFSCLCACEGQAAQANLVAELKQAQGKMTREMQLLGRQPQVLNLATAAAQVDGGSLSRAPAYRSSFQKHQEHRISRLQEKGQHSTFVQSGAETMQSPSSDPNSSNPSTSIPFLQQHNF